MASRPDLRLEDESGFIKFFRNLPPADSSTVRVFDRGDYYSAHGENALAIAQKVYNTTSVIRQLGREPNLLPSVTMTQTVCRQYIRDALFRFGQRVEIWENRGRMEWKVAKRASPGSLEDVIDWIGDNNESTPMMLAAKISTRAGETSTIGICFTESSSQELGMMEFVDDNSTFPHFEALLIQLSIKEVLLESTDSVEHSKILAIAENCGCAVSRRNASDFSVKDIEADLSRLLRDEKANGRLPQSDSKLAMGAAACLIKYLGLLGDASSLGKYTMYQHDLAQYMRLDASAVKALNLMPGHRDGSKTMSLWGVLNHCKTPMGPRLLTQWLRQPLLDVDAIDSRLSLVDAFVQDTELRQTMQEEHLRSMPDLNRLVRKFHRKSAGLEDVVRAYQSCIRLPGILGTLDGVMLDDGAKSALDQHYTAKIHECSNNLGKLQQLVESTIDLEALEQHDFRIRHDFDQNLQALKSKIDKVRREIDAEHRRVGDDLGQDTEKKLILEQHRIHGWCLRLTRGEASCIRNQRQYHEITTQKNGVYFTTEKLTSLRRNWDQLNESYTRHQSGLADEVVTVASSYTPVLETLAGIIAHLDVIVSFAHAAVHAPIAYTRPKIHPRGTGSTVLKEARHPCLELQDDINFITNDVSLVRGSSEFLIITGPNMGGKSTYIRQIGVIALMAQIGSFVPCSEAEVCLFDSILARVGASDSQLKGVSTFMNEMLETASILKAATRDSLIIIDELGRGTSTHDGFGLAWAIAEHIVREIQAFALFATHFHELTALADQWPQVQNLHVVAHVDDDQMEVDGGPKRREVTLLYKVEPGVSDQSFGIHVAKMVQFPEKVVNMAQRKADELEDFEGKVKDTEEILAEDEEKGRALLKAALMQWSEAVDGKNLSPDEQVSRLREIVNGNQELLSSPFFKGVLAL